MMWKVELAWISTLCLTLSACPVEDEDPQGTGPSMSEGSSGSTTDDPGATSINDPTGGEDTGGTTAGDPDTGSDEGATTGEPGGPLPCQSQEGAVVVEDRWTAAAPGSPAGPAADDDFAGSPPAAGGGFIPDPDGGGVTFECDPFAQDCPEGEKCMPWANDGGSAWNATRCSPIADNPGQVGDVCTVEGSGVSGIDDCDMGAMCFDVDPETNEGTCVEMCSGDETNPICETANTTCTISNQGSLVLCRPICNPLADECAPGEGCYPVNDSMVCAPDASGEAGVAGDPCEFLNVCDSGLLCAGPEVVPGCQASGCCSSFCTIGGDDSGCLEGQTCIPFFPDGAPAECLSEVGICSA